MCYVALFFVQNVFEQEVVKKETVSQSSIEYQIEDTSDNNLLINQNKIYITFND